MKHFNSLRRNVWFAVFVLLPTLLATIYYGLIASDQYVSESMFIVKSQSKQGAQVSTLANLIQTTGLSAGQEQTNEVMSYIRSRNALEELNHSVDVRKKFMQSDIDRLSRYPEFWRSDRFENLFRFYRDKIRTHLDTESGLAVLQVRAFTPADAQNINLRLLDFSEQLVNRLNEKSRNNAIAEAERRVLGAQKRVLEARRHLTAYRNREGLLDPAKQASGVLEVTNRLVAERALLQTQLDLMQRVTPQHPSLPSLRNRISAISGEIDAQTGRAVGTDSGIASKLGNYENLMLEQEFAATTLTAANASLEQARSEAARQQFYLERVVEPNKPDLSQWPPRITRILTIAGTALCLYLIGWMVVVGILEHSPED